MRGVFDTNVIISALLFGGRLEFISELLIQGSLTPCFSHATWRELKRALEYPHLAKILHKHDLNSDDLLARLGIGSVFFSDTTSPIAVSRDPADEAILACATAASAEVIITGDKDLLSLANVFSIPILSPSQFKSFLQSKK